MERVISDYKMHALDTMRKKQDWKSERRKELQAGPDTKG